MAADLLQFMIKELQLKGGIEKRLYCSREGKISPHISIDYNDAMDIAKKKKGTGDFEKFIFNANQLLFGLPGGGMAQSLFKAMLGQPYMCESCGKMRTD